MLSPEQLAAFNGKFEDSQPVSEVPTETTQVSSSTTSSESAPDNKDKEERRIPYARFQEVNNAKRAAEERAKNLEAQLNEARSKSEPKTFIDELLEQERNGQIPDGIDARLSAVEKLYAQQLLDNTLSSAARDYPDLPQEIVLAALGAGKSVEDAVDMWENMRGLVLGSQAKQPAQQVAKQPPATPPLPNKAPPVGNPKPKTMDEAHQAFKRFLQTQPRR